MRRLIVAATLSATVFAIAACGSGRSPTVSAATTAATADLTAATTAACAEAVKVSDQAAADFATDINKLINAALAAGSTDAESKAIEEQIRVKLTTWSDTLTALASRPIDARVKAALTQAATLIAALNGPNDKTPAEAASRDLATAAQKIKEGCG